MRYITAIITTILLSIVFTACRMDHPDLTPQGSNNSIRLNIGHTLERVEESNQLLTHVKGAQNDIYAVQIYKKIGNDFSKYSYGIFDDQTLMFIELEADVYYKIEMTMVPNGVTIIATDDNGGYQAPFLVGTSGNVTGKVANEFIISRTIGMHNLDSGQAMLTQLDTNPAYEIPPISRFYGFTEKEFKPNKDMKVTINLKWVVFGLTITTENFTEGSIEIEMRDAPKLIITPSSHDAITKKIFTLKGSDALNWCADGYTENIQTKITLIKGDGITRLTLLDRSIEMKRKYNKIINIQCGSNESSNSLVNISKEKPELIDDPEDI